MTGKSGNTKTQKQWSHEFVDETEVSNVGASWAMVGDRLAKTWTTESLVPPAWSTPGAKLWASGERPRWTVAAEPASTGAADAELLQRVAKLADPRITLVDAHDLPNVDVAIDDACIRAVLFLCGSPAMTTPLLGVTADVGEVRESVPPLELLVGAPQVHLAHASLVRGPSDAPLIISRGFLPWEMCSDAMITALVLQVCTYADRLQRRFEM